MTALHIANALVLTIGVWAVWERRATFRSRWDAPFTIGMVIFGIGLALDSPWSAVAAASFPLTGKFFLLNTLGHICFLTGVAFGIGGIYIRLMPDARFRRFITKVIAPLVLLPAAVMLVCVVASPVTTTRAAHLYFVRPDAWMTVYWVVVIVAMIALEAISTYGLLFLRREHDAVAVDAHISAQALGVMSVALLGVGVLKAAVSIPVAVWTLCYIAATWWWVVAVVMWRERVADFFRPPGVVRIEEVDDDPR